MRVLTLNPGSSSMGDPGAVAQAIRRWSDVDAIAVRFVHGGAQKAPAPVDDACFVAEHQPEMITAVLSGLGVLGLLVGDVPHTDLDRIVPAADSPVHALIILPREDPELASGAEEALTRGSRHLGAG
ncbi:hypothetical protein AB0M83_16430 [Amycolatopsis sp. NPDC051106]|uniref:hypothetical protein n=1 Tax=unclassified Amycolatopsis TaxID=2618356 RepID=UPI00341C9219